MTNNNNSQNNNSSLSNLKNLYEVRKTVRFGLLPIVWKFTKVEKSQDIKSDLDTFLTNYRKILLNFSEIVFNTNKNWINKKLKLKFSFLKTFTKKEYYENEVEKLKFNKTWKKLTINQIEVWNTNKLDYLFELFKNFEERNNFYLENIERVWLTNEENKSRKSDLAYYFHQLTRKTNFDFIKNLFDNNINTEWNLSSQIELTKKLLFETEKLILKIEKTLLPSQSMWQVIEKASFNYYTVNKKTKDYDEEILKKKNFFDLWLYSFTYFDKKENKKREIFNEKNIDYWFHHYLRDLSEKEFTKRQFWNIEKLEKKYMYLKIENAYKSMKLYKAEQKMAFMEFLSQEKTFLDLQNHIEIYFDVTNNETSEKENRKVIIHLFDDVTEKNFNTIIGLTNQIKILSEIKNTKKQLKEIKNYQEWIEKIKNLLENYNAEYQFIIDFDEDNLEEIIKKVWEELTEIKKERWKYFFEWDTNWRFSFPKYWKYCEEYKKVAIEYWRIKAHIKSLEKEKVDAEKTDSWALIMENKNNKYLLTIPRNINSKLERESNLNKAKNEIDKLNDENNWDWILYKFESLTLRALDKLCFWKENNTFRWNIYNEISKYWEFVIKSKNWNIKLKDKFEFTFENNWEKIKDEKLLLKFYKTVLSLESTKKQIIITHFKYFDNIKNWKFESLEEFEKELKKVCYVKNKVFISSSKKDYIINTFNAKLFKITSYDLEKDDYEIIEKLKNKKELDRNNAENHTKIWIDFWDKDNELNKYPIRINPEIKISYVEKDEEWANNNSWKKYNRRLTDRYLLTSTISLNSLEKEIDLSFKEKKEIIKTYENYNNKFNKNLKQNWLKYFYWLDRWEKELITLWLFDFSKDKNEEKWVKIKGYKLKEEKFFYSDKKNKSWENILAYKNISYYQYDDYKELYDELDLSCLDLTTAKYIKWKIYLNWDISTYLNLKLFSAKRKIYDFISLSKNKSDKIIFENNKIFIEWNKNKDEILYFYDERYKSIVNEQNLVEELQKYFDKVKINLNDNDEVSIEKVNNLRDSICANMVWVISYLQNDFPWMIFFENKNIKWKIWDFKNNATSLWSRIELKLLQKFSSLSLVLPIYKQALSLQDEKFLEQFWIIWYIDINWTSSNCPICWWNLFWHWKWPDFENMMHHYKEWNWIDYWKLLEDARKTKNDNCDYHMKNNKNWFSFLTSWDDLATYNIAKKWLEYINSLTI